MIECNIIQNWDSYGIYICDTVYGDSEDNEIMNNNFLSCNGSNCQAYDEQDTGTANFFNHNHWNDDTSGDDYEIDGQDPKNKDTYTRVAANSDAGPRYGTYETSAGPT